MTQKICSLWFSTYFTNEFTTPSTAPDGKITSFSLTLTSAGRICSSSICDLLVEKALISDDDGHYFSGPVWVSNRTGKVGSDDDTTLGLSELAHLGSSWGSRGLIYTGREVTSWDEFPLFYYDDEKHAINPPERCFPSDKIFWWTTPLISFNLRWIGNSETLYCTIDLFETKKLRCLNNLGCRVWKSVWSPWTRHVVICRISWLTSLLMIQIIFIDYSNNSIWLFIILPLDIVRGMVYI